MLKVKKCSCCKEPTNVLMSSKGNGKKVKDVCIICYEELTGKVVHA